MDFNSTLISIIIPVYNAEKYLCMCLESIVNQTYKNLEIICVDDGSQDYSVEILNRYAERDNRMKVLTQKNSGASVARNNALDIATGDYFAFVDSDDWLELNTFEVALKSAIENDADVVMWDYKRERVGASQPKNIFENDKVFEGKKLKELHRRFVGVCGEELKNPEKADALSTIWGKLYSKKSIYEYNIRFYDIRKIATFEDGLFNLDVFENVKKVIYLHEHLYHYRKDNYNSVTTVYKPDLVEKHERIHEYLKKYIEENMLGEDYITALNNRIALELVGYGLNILKLPKNKLKEIENIISKSYYKNAYSQLDFKWLPVHWKLFYRCAKYKFAFGVYILLLCMKIIRKK